MAPSAEGTEGTNVDGLGELSPEEQKTIERMRKREGCVAAGQALFAAKHPHSADRAKRAQA